MSTLKANRIKAFLEKSFRNLIDLSDLSNKAEEDKNKNFYSRALAAYALTVASGINIEDAAMSITDGYDDNGLDAIFFDKPSKNLWLVQSKFISSGTGGVGNGEIEKFAKGVKKLIDGDFTRFNKKVNNLKDDILEALDDSFVKIQLLFAYTGKEFSRHNEDVINDLLKEQNDTDEILIFNNFNIDKAYKGLEGGLNPSPISEDILISSWGHIEEPLKSYYGQITGTDLGILWQKYGRRLFTENIRSFLGNSVVNDDIIKTIKLEPENFIYFNNGITILCDSIKKKPIGGADKSIGAFTCVGISVVNGAQTLGSIGSLSESNENELGRIKVFVKFISLEDTSEGFGQRITIATNTQNKVDRKDFVSLDPEQNRLKIELKLDGIDYHYKRSNEKITTDDTNYLLEEVAFALAARWNDVDYSTMIKKESGRLWDDVTNKPYTDLFNANISGQQVINSVRIYRFVSNKMRVLAAESEGRERSINLYGNSLVSHLILQKAPKYIWQDDAEKFDKFYDNNLESITNDYIDKLHKHIEYEYPESMIVYILRNYTKCRHLKTLMI